MSSSQTLTLFDAAQSLVVPPSDFSNAPERVKEIAAQPFQKIDLKQVVETVLLSGFYERSAIEEAVISLITGHLLLSGPPGTGKTSLARSLASAFSVEIIAETANPEWSIYDVIGSQSLNQTGGAIPKHGIITRSILECAAAIVRSADTGNPPYAVWLLIDEFNRAEIDRAFGPLFTALSSDVGGSFTLDYYDNFPQLFIPERFRIIGAMNDFDTRFVNSMSTALRRRFKRTLILPPENIDGKIPEGEFQVALEKADVVLSRKTGGDITPSKSILTDNAELIREVFGSIRSLGEAGGIPVGTAQIIDFCIYFMGALFILEKPKNEHDVYSLVDRTLVTQLINSLESDSIRLEVTDSFPDKFAEKFPLLIKTNKRLGRFLGGR